MSTNTPRLISTPKRTLRRRASPKFRVAGAATGAQLTKDRRWVVRPSWVGVFGGRSPRSGVTGLRLVDAKKAGTEFLPSRLLLCVENYAKNLRRASANAPKPIPRRAMVVPLSGTREVCWPVMLPVIEAL